MGRRPESKADRLLVVVLTTVLAVCLIIGGLTVVGVLVLLVFGMANFGSNK
ncbi:hypothetical protein HUT06_02270 [Actinomadura sp. NAK00032]|uniref:hypothetical protein n=1 Tax=Actinomadura sp. NAK00032 TaxID=2742128 RepID=UPI001591C81E|nr:hypothetical protein [Actinomadura sp. NAK00032]QKW33010.1 hypothetical protein HUT06_02270 [Actinomadura sp. NAK00032]